MAELQPDITASVPAQPEASSPVTRRLPVVMVLVGIVILIGAANLTHLVSGKGSKTAKSSLITQPATTSPQQVKSYQAMQAVEAQRDAEERQQQAQFAQAQQQIAAQESAVPGPEADSAAPMTQAQREAIYGSSPNAPQRTSGASEMHAEARQRQLARAKERQDALNADTVAIDFSPQNASPEPGSAKSAKVLGEREQAAAQASGEDLRTERSDFVPATGEQPEADTRKQDVTSKADPMRSYPFDTYEGQLYRVFEGTVLEGVVTNHIDGGFPGPILVMLTTDLYSHDHQRLLLPQGTRLIGSVQSVGNQGQRKLMVTFHRAVCPDGFSLEFNQFIGLDPVGTTGLATHVNSHILSSFAAAAAIGGLGGLAQIGNSASVLSPSAGIRDGISSQTSQESEQILNRFLSRLPVITLKEGSRARVYIGTDVLIPSYAAHRVDPTL